MRTIKPFNLLPSTLKEENHMIAVTIEQVCDLADVKVKAFREYFESDLLLIGFWWISLM